MSVESEGAAETVERRAGNPAVRLLTEGPYKWFLLSNLLGGIGMELRLMAQSWLILELGGSQFDVGAANGLRVVPAVLLSLAAGVLIDRVGGRKILIWDRALLFLLAVATAVLVLFGPIQVWHVIALSTLAGAVIGLGGPSMHTLITRIVPRSDLQSANSLGTFAYSVARAIGPMIGGLLIAWYGLGSPWIALAVIYVLSTVLLLSVPDVRPESSGGQDAVKSLVEGLRYVWGEPLILRSMILAFSVIAGMTVFPVWPILARDRFGVGETGFGVMMAVFAVGQGISAVYVTARGGWVRKSRPILVSSFCWAVMMVVVAFTHSYIVCLCAMAVMGAGIPPWITSVSTILQTQSREEMLGRVMSVFVLSFQIAYVGWLIGGWLGEWIGNDWMLLSMAAAYFGMQVLLFATSKEMRGV